MRMQKARIPEARKIKATQSQANFDRVRLFKLFTHYKSHRHISERSCKSAWAITIGREPTTTRKASTSTIGSGLRTLFFSVFTFHLKKLQVHSIFYSLPSPDTLFLFRSLIPQYTAKECGCLGTTLGVTIYCAPIGHGGQLRLGEGRGKKAKCHLQHS